MKNPRDLIKNTSLLDQIAWFRCSASYQKNIVFFDKICLSIIEIFVVFAPIIPSSLMYRLIFVLFYSVFYMVSGHERYNEIKEQY